MQIEYLWSSRVADRSTWNKGVRSSRRRRMLRGDPLPVFTVRLVQAQTRRTIIGLLSLPAILPERSSLVSRTNVRI